MTYQFDPILGAGRDGKVTLAEQQAGFNNGTPAQQAAFQASVSGAKTAPALTGALNAIGDSHTFGAGPSTTAEGFAYRLAAYLGKTANNTAVGGSIVDRWLEQQCGSIALAAGDLTVMLSGNNNATYYGVDDAALENYQRTLIATAAFMALPDSKKVFTQTSAGALNTAQVTFNNPANWIAASAWKGKLANSRAGATSVNTGDYAQATVTGNTVYVWLAANNGYNSKVYITIDGVRYGASGTLNLNPNALADGGQVAQGYLFRATGLTSGVHVVRATLAGAQGQYTQVACFAGFDNTEVNLPVVLLPGAIKMSAAGYATGNATVASTRLYNDKCRRVAESLRRDGLLVRYVDIDSDLLISADALAADTVHYLAMVHEQIAHRLLVESRNIIF